MRRCVTALVLVLALASAACATPPLTHLPPGDVTPIREAVDAHPERTRVVALLSPT